VGTLNNVNETPREATAKAVTPAQIQENILATRSEGFECGDKGTAMFVRDGSALFGEECPD
jgi:hypothetical protein